MAIILVYGMPGTGKTTWMHDFIGAEENAAQRFFIVDHADEWGPDALHWRGRPPAKLEVFDRIEDAPQEPSGYPEEGGLYVFRDCEALAVARLACDIGNATFVDDEIDFSGGRSGWEDSPLRLIAHRGRHLANKEGEHTHVNILGACRRPQSLHPDLTALPEQVCIFRVQGVRTLERLQADSMMNQGDWEKISTMPDFNFLHWPSGHFYTVKPIGTKEHATGKNAPDQKDRGS